MDLHHVELHRFVDTFASIGDDQHTGTLLQEHAKYCSVAFYLAPPHAAVNMAAAAEYRNKLVDYCKELKINLNPYVIFPISPGCKFVPSEFAKDVEVGKKNGIVGVGCALNEWSIGFWLAPAMDGDIHSDVTKLQTMFHILEKNQMPLFLKAECGNNDSIDGTLRISLWEENGAVALRHILSVHPNLSVIVVNVTTTAMMDTILELGTVAKVFGTIGVQYLLMTADDVFTRGFDIGHNLPLPLPKWNVDRERLRGLAYMPDRSERRFMFSSGSSHHDSTEPCGVWCTRMFTLPWAAELFAESCEDSGLFCDVDAFGQGTATRAFPNIKLPVGTFSLYLNTPGYRQIPANLIEMGNIRPAFVGHTPRWFLTG